MKQELKGFSFLLQDTVAYCYTNSWTVRCLCFDFYWLLARAFKNYNTSKTALARILMKIQKYDHITPILHSLLWLPVSYRNEFKISLLPHQCIHGNAPPYLKSYSHHKPPHVTSAPETKSFFTPTGPNSAPWGIRLSAQPLLACGIPSQTT